MPAGQTLLLADFEDRPTPTSKPATRPATTQKFFLFIMPVVNEPAAVEAIRVKTLPAGGGG